MAIMHPQTYPGEVWAEERVFESLRRLPDSWHVIADVLFPVVRDGASTLDGQVDLVLVHERFGAIVIEVKGGDISVEDGEWKSSNRDGVYQIKDPFAQAKDYKYVLRDIVEERTGLSPWWMHAVAFPSTSQRSPSIGTQPSDLVLFQSDLDRPVEWIERLLRHHKPREQNLSSSQVGQIVSALVPTVSLHIRTIDSVERVLTKQVELTRTQRMTFEMTRSMNRLWVRGGAGTGKTVLAIARARQLASQGQRVLLVCFNKPLGQKLREQFDDLPTVTAGSFHSVATQLVGPKPQTFTDKEWLQIGLANSLLDRCATAGKSWDAIIVDEGQDFPALWLEVLEQLLPSPGRGQLVVFADDNQNLFSGGGHVSLPSSPIELDVNFRNTPEISDRAFAAVGLQIECTSPSGIAPTVEIADSDLMALVRKRLHQIIVDGQVPVDRVVLLSSSRALVDGLRGSRIGRWDIVGLEGKGLKCETIHRFKGLEADAVLLILPDGVSSDEKLLYVGASRARALLSIIAEPQTAQRYGLEPSM